MYANYVDECKNTSPFSYVKYTRQIRELNISFAKLGSEECEICDEHMVHLKRNVKNNDISNESEEANRRSKKIDMMTTCNGECEKCSLWKDHYKKYCETRSAYKNDKYLVGIESDTLFQSADMQKIILLPRLPEYKVCIFTKRLVVINQSFAPLNKEEVGKKKSLAVIWHEEIKGRNDEDVTSAFLKCMNFVDFRDYENFVLWFDNCAGRNKNWTLYTALTNYVNLNDAPKSITLKYFAVGHTFMSADSFHHRIESEMKKMKDVCDWSDFKKCVQNAGQYVEMEIEDFKNHESGLTQSKASKETRPLLDTISVVRFEKGSFDLSFKTSHSDSEFKKSIFLQKKIITRMTRNEYKVESFLLRRGIKKKKKEDIVKKLDPLMKPSRLRFFEDLVSEEDIPDMMVCH